MLENMTLGVITNSLYHTPAENMLTTVLLKAADQRGFNLFYLEPFELYLQYGIAWGTCHALQIASNQPSWYTLSAPTKSPLSQFDLLLMNSRANIDLAYFYSTYLLERAEQNGVWVINKPQGLRDAHEKIFATLFPQCMPPTVITSSISILKSFIEEQELVVLKPLQDVDNQPIFRGDRYDPNLETIIKHLTQNGKHAVIAQRFIEATLESHKYILLVDGEPLPYGFIKWGAHTNRQEASARIVTTLTSELTEQEWWICSQIGPQLRERGLVLAGAHVIDGYLTEINVNNPLDIQIVENEVTENIAEKVLDYIIDTLDE